VATSRNLTIKKRPQKAGQLLFHCEKVEASSGNVFADLGLPDAEELLDKSKLAVRIAEIAEQWGWTKSEVTRRAGIHEHEMSNLLRGRLSGFSAAELSAILNRLRGGVRC
jgi:predicted XRE-type DNA-binding protein